MHNQRSSLEIHAEELGHDVSPWSQYYKFFHLLNGISDSILDASKNAIISDLNGLRSNFAKFYCRISDFLESTAASNSGNNRNVSDISGDRNVRNQNGQGRGNGSHMAHVDAEVRGKQSTGTRGRRQMLMPVPTSMRNATPMRGIEPLMVMSVIKCGKIPRGVLKMLMPLPPIR